MITGKDVLINGVNIFSSYNIRCVSLDTSKERDFLFNRSVVSRNDVFTGKVDNTFSVVMSFAKVHENSQVGLAKFEDCDYEVMMELLTQSDIVEVEKNGKIYYLSPTSGQVNRTFGVMTITFDSVSPYVYSPVITQQYVGSEIRFEVNSDSILNYINCDLTLNGNGRVKVTNEMNGVSLEFDVDGEVIIRGDEREINIDNILVDMVLECGKGHTVILVECNNDIDATLEYQNVYGLNYIHH